MKQIAKANAIFSLYNVGCISSAGIIEHELKQLSGIVAVNVNHVADTVSVEFDPTKIRDYSIRNYLERISQGQAKDKRGNLVR